MSQRKHYLDNIRWITVLIVIVYHIIYVFNCSGVISNIDIQGIAILDTLLIFVYPWFMCLLFIISGISCRYSLQKRTEKEFIKDRVKRILVPSIAGIFAYGWVSGFITNKYVDMFAGNGDSMSGFLKYIIYSLMGIGPLWFAQVLFIACVALLIVRKIDKKDRMWEKCKDVNLPILLVLTFVVWLSSLILNTPVITVYRFGIYLFMFFLGYFVFSHDEVLEKIEKVGGILGISALILGIMYVFHYYGTNYADDSCLQSFFTNAYLWIAILGIFGLGKKYLNFQNKFSKYMTENNFNFYVLHYVVVISLSYIVVTYFKLPFAINYVLILLGTIIILPILVEIVKRIPIVRNLILGIYKTK